VRHPSRRRAVKFSLSRLDSSQAASSRLDSGSKASRTYLERTMGTKPAANVKALPTLNKYLQEKMRNVSISQLLVRRVGVGPDHIPGPKPTGSLAPNSNKEIHQ
jgi:hypothetical protein